MDFGVDSGLGLERGLDLLQRLFAGSGGEQKIEALGQDLIPIKAGEFEEAVVGEDDRLVGFPASVKTIAMRVVSAATTNGPRSSLNSATSASARF